MIVSCPHCAQSPNYVIDSRTIVRHGRFRRASDSRLVERWRCRTCKKTFSQATGDPSYRQKKRQKNKAVFELLASGVSMRRTARLLRVSRHTVARRLRHLGERARDQLQMETAFHRTAAMQFDDMETFEHTKYKPLSITLAVEEGSRRILGFRVARMASKGVLSEKAKAKYGPRPDERTSMRRDLFEELGRVVTDGASIRSDSNPYYPADVKRFFPRAKHLTCLGKRGAVTGQGELKKIGFDPLFSLNHTCAMNRDNVKRLARKTWCTTKDRDRLADLLAIYAVYHNAHLKPHGGSHRDDVYRAKSWVRPQRRGPAITRSDFRFRSPAPPEYERTASPYTRSAT